MCILSLAASMVISKVMPVVLRVLLAITFLVSAVSKLLALDQFEIYTYSYGFFPLTVTYILVRLCIAAELVLGVMIALGWWRRIVCWLTLLMLAFFSAFLIYAAAIGRNESCQCFGQLMDINPVQSLLKNVVLMVLVLAYAWHVKKQDQNCTTRRCRLKLWLTGAIVAVSLATVFVISVPDNWMFGNGNTRFDKERLVQMQDDPQLAELQLGEGHKLVAFVTPGCPYCKLARQKLTTIEERNHIAPERILYVEPGAEIEGYVPSDERTHGIDTELFMQITRGARPFLVLLEDGEPTVTFHYRNISERRIKASLCD